MIPIVFFGHEGYLVWYKKKYSSNELDFYVNHRNRIIKFYFIGSMFLWILLISLVHFVF